MQVDTGAFRALVEDVERIKRHLAAQDMLGQILAARGVEDAALAMAEAAGIQQGLAMARGRHRATRRMRRERPAHLRPVGDEGRPS